MEVKKPVPSKDEAEVVTSGCKEQIDGTALLVGEEVAAHVVTGLEKADDRLEHRA